MRVLASAIFLGAFLLFQVQPIIGKFVLPWFGGSPAVWTTCLLFFQVLLLAGYGYAHASVTWWKPRTQAAVHLALMVAALLLLPIVPEAHWKPAPSANPTLHILFLLTVCLGLPYFLLSSTGPLLQAWFSRLHPGASPYRLYALSNAGSLLALLSFPIFVEPFLARRTQSNVWSAGFLLFVLLCGLCAVRLWRKNQPAVARAEAAPADSIKPGRAARFLWVSLSACASTLLLSTTNKMCQDVAVIPFLWVLPLSLYLLSFIICFDSPAWYRRNAFTLGFAAAAVVVCWVLFDGGALPVFVQLGAYGGALFVCCMVCHGELFRLRPPPQHLTAFYLHVATGGALGGAFVALAAPRWFHSFVELHWGLFLLALLLLWVHAHEQTPLKIGTRTVPAWKPGIAAVLMLSALLAVQAWVPHRHIISMTRNFYGVLRLREFNREMPGDSFRVLDVGEIIHGIQFQHPSRARQPATYFHEQSGIGLALRHWPQMTNRHIGIIGLGVGTLATYGLPGDRFRFYEINPAVVRVAREQFSFLSSSPAAIEVVLGDARLSLESEPPQHFDILVLDAFTSDAIPVHLLTREAMEVYLRHLKSEGLLALHISNRHLDLRPVVQNLARHFGLESAVVVYLAPTRNSTVLDSTWVLLTTRREFLAHPIIQSKASPEPAGASHLPLWTDDYASLFPLLRNFAAP